MGRIVVTDTDAVLDFSRGDSAMRVRLRSAVVFLLLAVGAAVHAQAPSTLTPAALVGCYDLTVSEWSPEYHSAYHRIPARIRLDSVAAARGGWVVSPDISYPTPSRFPGTPRWTVTNDTIQIVWSNGFQPTVVRLVQPKPGELSGHAVARSDANEYGHNPPRANVTARRVPC
jgi:hypothetical protein